MELTLIDEQRCKTCKSKVVSEKSSDKHTNGKWNEYREFECQKTHLFSTLHTLHSCLYSKFIYEGNEYPLKYKVPVNIKMRNRYDLYSRI